MAEGAPEPEATGLIQSCLPNTRICPALAWKCSVRKASSAWGLGGSCSSVSVATTSCAAWEIRKSTSTSARTRHSSRRSAYWAPEAPVTARVTRRGSAMAMLQRLLKLLVDTTEAAVAHDHHPGAGLRLGCHLLDDRIDVGHHLRRYRAVTHHRIQRPVQSRRLVPDHLAGVLDAARQRRHVTAQTHGVGARLDDRQQPLVADTGAQPRQGGGDGGGMVGEIVIQGDAPGVGNLLHAPLGTGKTRQRRYALLRRHAHMTRRRQRTERIGHTVGAGLLPLGDALQLPVQPDLEARAILGQQPRLPVAALAGGLDRSPAALAEDRKSVV